MISVFERAVRDWDFDGLKLDFIDEFANVSDDPALRENYAGRDILGVPDAVNRLMKDSLHRLKMIKPEVLVEFRQGYIGPAIRQYGNMIRALDCPCDPFSNRRRIVSLRLTSGPIAVHSDMLAWNRDETPEGAALSILNAIFGIIQYSMRLDTLGSVHGEVIRHWIDFSRRHRDTLVKGNFKPLCPEAGFPQIESESAQERIVAVYDANRVISVSTDKTTILLNATMARELIVENKLMTDWQSFDTFGHKIDDGHCILGIGRLPVPPSGYICFDVLKNHCDDKVRRLK